MDREEDNVSRGSVQEERNRNEPEFRTLVAKATARLQGKAGREPAPKRAPIPASVLTCRTDEPESAGKK